MIDLWMDSADLFPYKESNKNAQVICVWEMPQAQVLKKLGVEKEMNLTLVNWMGAVANPFLEHSSNI